MSMMPFLACAGRGNMEKALVAVIEAIFTVMGEPYPEIFQCYLALDKWTGMLVGPCQNMLGLHINTSNMTVEITAGYKAEVWNLIDTTWNPDKPVFVIHDMYRLVGQLTRLGGGAPWIYKLMSHLYISLAFALKRNTKLLAKSTDDFKALIEQTKRKQLEELQLMWPNRLILP